MIPVPEINEPRPTPVEFLPFEAPSALGSRPVRATSLLSGGVAGTAEELGIGALMRFKTMMAADGQPVHLARLCYDRLYAYERIAVAHTSADEPLRRLALELFQIYHRRESAGRPAQ